MPGEEGRECLHVEPISFLSLLSSSPLLHLATMVLIIRLVSAAALLLATIISATEAFSTHSQCLIQPRSNTAALAAHKEGPTPPFDNRSSETTTNIPESRRNFLASSIAGSTASAIILAGNTLPALAEDADSSFESIAARAARVSQEVTEAEKAKAKDEEADQRRKDAAQKLKEDTRTIYDFTLPIGGKSREVAELVGQTFGEGSDADGWGGGQNDGPGNSVKAILVVNIKQDDPIARKNIPELIALSRK